MTQKEMIETINKMTNEQQNNFYNRLRKNGVSESDIQTIQAVAFFNKLHSCPELFSETCDEMSHRLYAEFRGGSPPGVMQPKPVPSPGNAEDTNITTGGRI